MPQHRAPRSLLTAAALVVSVALTGCGDDAEEAQSGGQPAAETSAAEPSESPAQSPEPAPAGATLAIEVSGDEVSPLGETIEMAAGDTLTVRITSDRPGELHVHSSPEQYVEFGPGSTRQRVTIDKPGQVDVEEHDSGSLVARLLVS